MASSTPLSPRAVLVSTRTGFKFFQAYFDPEQGDIRGFELRINTGDDKEDTGDEQVGETSPGASCTR